jgi:large subunit ribosomal protein L33
MAKKENRLVIMLKSSESAHTYTTSKNKTNTTARLEISKYDPFVRRHVMYKESK